MALIIAWILLAMAQNAKYNMEDKDKYLYLIMAGLSLVFYAVSVLAGGA